MSSVYQIVTDNIVSMLEQGVVPWRKPWTNSINGNFPRSATNRPYRGINVFILWFEQMKHGYNSNFWLTYNQAEKMGGNVRKGEKSTMITFWKVGQAERDPETGKMRRPFMLRYYRVFNLDQCENIKMTKAMLAETNREEFVDDETRRQAMIDDAEAIVATYFARDDAPTLQPDGGNEAFYVPAMDTIKVPARDQFANIEDFYATMFHEMTHSTGNPTRLNRKAGDFVGHSENSYGREELVAEMGNAFLTATAGITTTIENSAAYINSWLNTIKGDPMMVVQAASAAQKAADYILGTTFESEDETDD